MGVIIDTKMKTFLISLFLFISICLSYGQGGPVSGPTTAVSNSVPVFKDTKKLQTSPVIIHPVTGDIITSGNIAASGNLSASNLVSLDGQNHIPGNYLDASQQTLTFSSTNVTINLSSNRVFYLLLTTNAYFVQPAAFTNGQTFIVHLIQDSIGSRTVNFDTAYWKFPAGTNSSPTSTSAGAWDILTAVTSPYGTNIAVLQTSDFR